MKKSNMGNSSAAGGKGFYLALILSVAAVGTVAYFTISKLNEELQSVPESSERSIEWSMPESFSEVDKSQSNVKKEPSSAGREDTPPESSTPAPSSVPNKEEETFFFSSSKEETPPAADSGYIMPLDGEILNPYSAGELVKSKTLGEWRTHDGIDIKAEEGTPVKAVGDGTVLDVRDDRQWGVVVEIQHKDFVGVYAGLSSQVQVNKGQEVSLGDVIGSVGNSSIIESAETGHLHFAAKDSSGWLDPLSALGQ